MKRIIQIIIFTLCFIESKSQNILGGYLALNSGVGFYRYYADLYLYCNPSSNLNRQYVLLDWGGGLDTLKISQINFYNGITLKKYSGSHIFASTGSYEITYVDTFRVSGIKNMTNSQLETITLIIDLNIESFASNKNHFPLPQNLNQELKVVGNDVSFNPKMMDMEGDSLYYSLYPCTTGNYYTPSNVSLNNQTGELNFSKDSIGLYAFSYKIEEWGKSFGTVYLKSSNIYDFTLNITTEVGIKKYSFSDEINIYPNPASSIINIKDDFYCLAITIQNTIGQIVISTPFVNQIDVSNLNSGVYILSLMDNVKTKKIKFIKE